MEYIRTALQGVENCRHDGINVSGYMYWSLIDNYGRQSGYAMRFGLIEKNEDHTVKPSLAFLGAMTKKY